MKKSNKKSELFLSVRDLQRLVPLSRGLLYKLARRLGKRIGRRLLVPRARFDRWLRSGGAS